MNSSELPLGSSPSSSSSSQPPPTEWTWEENKVFERAIAELDHSAPDFLEKIRMRLPTKTLEQIEQHYISLLTDIANIESGCIPIPDYVSDQDMKRRSEGWPSNWRKGIPWTEEEHRLFILGLEELGKGNWKNISRYFVKTRNPAQVASHAQKYFKRKDRPCSPRSRRRASVLDIQTAHSTPNPPMPQTTVCKPIEPSSVPPCDPINSPPSMNNIPMAGSSPSSHNMQGTSTNSVAVAPSIPSSMPLSFGSISIYDYDETFGNYPLNNGPSNDNQLSNSLMNDMPFPHIDTNPLNLHDFPDYSP